MYPLLPTSYTQYSFTTTTSQLFFFPVYSKFCKFVTHPNNSTEKEPSKPTSRLIVVKLFKFSYDSGNILIFLLFCKYNSRKFVQPDKLSGSYIQVYIIKEKKIYSDIE